MTHATTGAGPCEHELGELIKELPFVYFRLRDVGDRFAARAGQTTGKWGLLRSLAADGPQSVAQAARARPVARQWVQRLADELASEGLIEFIDNPAHKRARLMRLTARGERLLRRMESGIDAWTRRAATAFDSRALRTTREVLRKLRERLAQD